ncbi:MAG: Mov34/MPN/PAD-1 family protein [Candidatus Helarchaeota archaeon]
MDNNSKSNTKKTASEDEIVKKAIEKATEREGKKRESDVVEPGKVRISLEAYETIVLHACRFANVKIPMDSWKEIYGFLIGVIDGDDVIVKRCVPMAHGSSVEVEFNEEHYIKSAEVDSMAAERGEFIVGWYHSHPGLGLFLSSTDIQNHLGYQGPNPKAIALVFDHTLLNKPLEDGTLHPGFEIFKLDDPSLGRMSDFHKVDYEIENVDMKKFRETLVELTERSMLNQPLIAEYGEEGGAFGKVGEEGGGIDISTTPLGKYEITVPAMNAEPLLDGMVEGFKRMMEEILPSTMLSFGDQTKKIMTIFQDFVNKQIKSLNDLSEILSIGIGELKKKIMDKIDESHEGLSNMMAVNFDSFKPIIENMANDVSDMEDRILDDLNMKIDGLENKINVRNTELKESIITPLNEIKDSLFDSQKDIIDSLKLSINTMHDELANSIDLIGTQLKERMSSLKDLIETQTKSTADTNVLDEIKDSIKKLTEKMDNTLNKISKIEESMK